MFRRNTNLYHFLLSWWKQPILRQQSLKTASLEDCLVETHPKTIVVQDSVVEVVVHHSSLDFQVSF